MMNLFENWYSKNKFLTYKKPQKLQKMVGFKSYSPESYKITSFSNNNKEVNEYKEIYRLKKQCLKKWNRLWENKRALWWKRSANKAKNINDNTLLNLSNVISWQKSVLSNKNFIIETVEDDGHCLFKAISLRVSGTVNYYGKISFVTIWKI